MKLVAVALAVSVGAGCDRAPGVASCRADLGGVWRGEGTQRWMILDTGATLEVYPLFPDVPASPLEVAPRVIDLERQGDALAGVVRRRYLRGSDACTATAPAHVTSCGDGGLELVLADPPAPLAFAPCRFAGASPSHRERWRAD